jgi:transcriptional regulator with GAF, ATPase, and Fis domain
LRAAGVDVRGVDRAPDDKIGALLFDRESPELFETLARLTRRRNTRVLAIGVRSRTRIEVNPWDLVRAGASDVLFWEPPDVAAEQAAARFRRWDEVDRLASSSVVKRHLVGNSPAWLALVREVVEVARFTSASVLLYGESGTGKELVARVVHSLDPRPEKGDMVVLDCTTVVPTLSGSEFFGHERGAFTGAVSARAGAFELADEGTLFLDEVGELPLGLQAELLRVIQEGTYKRVGSSTWKTTKFRLICASNQDLAEREREGGFRRDFFYRIAGWTARLPPVSDRPEDILPLAEHFLSEFSSSDKTPTLDPAVCQFLLQRDYPGNVRDLRHLVARIAARHVGEGDVSVGDIPDEERNSVGSEAKIDVDESFDLPARRAVAAGLPLKRIGDLATEAAIDVALEEESGNVRRAAARLGVTDRTLQLRLSARKRPASRSDPSRETVEETTK